MTRPTHCPKCESPLETDADLRFCATCDYEESVATAWEANGYANAAEMEQSMDGGEHGNS